MHILVHLLSATGDSSWLWQILVNMAHGRRPVECIEN